jgi:hypothetical protein
MPPCPVPLPLCHFHSLHSKLQAGTHCPAEAWLCSFFRWPRHPAREHATLHHLALLYSTHRTALHCSAPAAHHSLCTTLACTEHRTTASALPWPAQSSAPQPLHYPGLHRAPHHSSEPAPALLRPGPGRRLVILIITSTLLLLSLLPLLLLLVTVSLQVASAPLAGPCGQRSSMWLGQQELGIRGLPLPDSAVQACAGMTAA